MSSPMQINLRNVVDSMKHRLLEYWKCLQQEFNVDTELKILTNDQYWDEVLSAVDNDESCEKKVESLRRSIKNYVKYTSKVPAYMEWSVNRINGNVHVYDVCVKMHLSQLQQKVFRGLADLDSVYDELKIYLRHEMGHVLDVMSFEGMSSFDYDNMIRLRIKEHKEILNNMKEPLLRKEKSLDEVYYSFPKERIANNYVGITTEMITESAKISDVHSLVEIYYQ